MTMMIGFAVLLAIAAIAAFLLVRGRSRRENRGHSYSAHLGVATTPMPAQVSPPPARPEALAEPATFDADATFVYLRPPQPDNPSKPRERDGARVDPAGATLVALSGSQKGNSFQVLAAGVTVGRNPACDIVLDDQRISSRHAWIGIIDGKAILRDLKSTNGTFLNAAIRSSVVEAELRPGDTISFGGHQGDQFRFMAR